MIVTTIPEEVTLFAGRLLLASGYKKIASCCVRYDNIQTVENMLNDLESTAGYTKHILEDSTQDEEQRIVGPFYSFIDGEELCLAGIAVWYKSTDN